MPDKSKNPQSSRTTTRSRMKPADDDPRHPSHAPSHKNSAGRSESGGTEKIVVIRRRQTKRTSPLLYGVLGGAMVLLLAAAGLLFYSQLRGAAPQPEQPIQVTKFPFEWELISEMNAEMQTLVFDPADRKIAYLGTQGAGLLKSVDGAATFQPTTLQGDSILDLSVDPKDPTIVWAAGMEAIYVSRDSGKTWRPAPGLPKGEAHVAQIDPADSTIIWAGYWQRGKPGKTLYRSTDGGVSWAELSDGPAEADINFVSFDAGPPGKPSITFVGTFGKGLFATSDGGKVWFPLNKGLPTNTDITLLAMSPDKKVFYAGTHDFGIYRSLDQGATWEESNKGKEEATDIHGILVQPDRPDVVWAAGMMHGKGVFRSDDKGQTWQPVETGDINLDDTHIFTLDAERKEFILGAGDHATGTGSLYRSKLNP